MSCTRSIPRTFMFALGLVVILGACGKDEPTDPDADINHAPVIDALTVSATGAAPLDTLALICTAHDADTDPLTYAWQATAGTIEGSGAQVNWIAPAEEGICEVSVTASDGRDGSAADTIAVAADALSGSLLVQVRSGLLAVDASGGSFQFRDWNTGVEVAGDRIFLTDFSSITEVDPLGQTIATVTSSPHVSGYITLLPDGGFAAITNTTDLIFMVEPTGAVSDTIPIPNGEAGSLQNISGVVVGNRLLVSENGNNEIFAVDLDAHATSIFRIVQDAMGWLGAIDYADGTYYLCRPQVLQTFTEDGLLQDLCALPVSNLSGVVATGHFAYVVVNFAGALYRVDRATGEYQAMLGGLDFPQEIEYVPVRLVER